MNTAGRSLTNERQILSMEEKFELDDQLLKRLVDKNRSNRIRYKSNRASSFSRDFSDSITRASLLTQRYLHHLQEFESYICPNMICDLLL